MEGPIKHAGIIGDRENDRVWVVVDLTSRRKDEDHAVIDDDRDIFQAIDGDECVVGIVF